MLTFKFELPLAHVPGLLFRVRESAKVAVSSTEFYALYTRIDVQEGRSNPFFSCSATFKLLSYRCITPRPRFTWPGAV
jgi:hypothetical protein